MVKMKAKYIGNGQVELEHGPSGSKLITDLPVDNGGQGRNFSPTDLFASSLAACVLTIMGMLAKRDGIEMTGAVLDFEKEMIPEPRRVGSIKGTLTLPPSVPEDKKRKLQAAVQACPVRRSLLPETEVDITVV